MPDSPFALLPMYPENVLAKKAFWERLKYHLRTEGLKGVPEEVFEPSGLEQHWTNPRTVLSQMCSYPFAKGARGRVQIVGVPLFDVAGFDDHSFRSMIIVRERDPARSLSDLRGRVAAFNSKSSQSGYNALRVLVAPLADRGRFFASTVETGGHRQSIDILLSGKADVAAIDCVTFAYAHRDGLTKGLRVLARSPAVPGLPVITSANTRPKDVERLRRAFIGTVNDPGLRQACTILRLRGFEIVDPSIYDECLLMEQAASDAGYPELL